MTTCQLRYLLELIFSFSSSSFFLHSQNETYREEFLNERKEKERALSLKDKLKRDLENYQSRISSLQEQVRSVHAENFFSGQ